MAKIDEEQILIRFSLLVPDSANVANTTAATEEIRSNVEAFAQGLVPALVLVEANFVSNVQV
jgi:hypothetical protein